MALIPETGNGDNPLANTYATADQLTGYAADRGITLTASPDVLLTKAMDYAESLSYPGRKVSETQPLQWPRYGTRVDGFNVPSNMIPGALVTAQIVTAIAIDQGRDPMAPIEPGIKEETVGPLTTVYQDGASSTPISLDISRAFARLLGGASGGANQVRVVRG